MLFSSASSRFTPCLTCHINALLRNLHSRISFCGLHRRRRTYCYKAAAVAAGGSRGRRSSVGCRRGFKPLKHSGAGVRRVMLRRSRRRRRVDLRRQGRPAPPGASSLHLLPFPLLTAAPGASPISVIEQGRQQPPGAGATRGLLLVNLRHPLSPLQGSKSWVAVVADLVAALADLVAALADSRLGCCVDLFKRVYLTWTDEMDAALLAVLVEHHNNGDHAQNGWKPHIYNAAIRNVREKCGVEITKDNISSRLTRQQLATRPK
nr:unnamed protein product [Digitaria exilis]